MLLRIDYSLGYDNERPDRHVLVEQELASDVCYDLSQLPGIEIKRPFMTDGFPCHDAWIEGWLKSDCFVKKFKHEVEYENDPDRRLAKIQVRNNRK
jgi:hypothetical protein